MKFSKTAIMGIISFLFGCSDTPAYHKKNGEWFYKDWPLDSRPSGNLQGISDLFGRDDDHAFYRNTVIPESDGKSFLALSDHYGKDKNHVYYCDTYRKGQEYFTVKHNSVKVLPEADATTFTFMTLGYGKDRDNVFYEGKSFPVSDVASYRILEESFSADKNAVYYHRIEIAGAEAASFKVLDNHYSKDARHIYYSEIYYDADRGPIPVSKAISMADAATFELLEEVTDEVDARDEHRSYKRGVIVK